MGRAEVAWSYDAPVRAVTRGQVAVFTTTTSASSAAAGGSMSLRPRIAGVAVAAAIAAGVAPGCSLGEGQGTVSGTLDVTDCWSGVFDLKPDFFAAVPSSTAATGGGSPTSGTSDALLLRIQNGGDFESFSDGLAILIDDAGEVRGDPAADGTPRPSLLDKNLVVSLPDGVEPSGVPIAPVPNPGIVHATLYLEKTCRTQNVALYALSAVTLNPDGTCNRPDSGDAPLPCDGPAEVSVPRRRRDTHRPAARWRRRRGGDRAHRVELHRFLAESLRRQSRRGERAEEADQRDVPLLPRRSTRDLPRRPRAPSALPRGAHGELPLLLRAWPACAAVPSTSAMLPRRVPALPRREAVRSHRDEALSHRDVALSEHVPMPSHGGRGLSHHDEACAPRGREASCPEKNGASRRNEGVPDAREGPSRHQKGPDRARSMPPPRGRMPPHGERGPAPRGHA